MHAYEFTAHYGNKTADVRLLEVSAGAQTFHVYINKYYYGNLVKMPDGWVHHGQQPHFYTDDIQILGYLIETEILSK